MDVILIISIYKVKVLPFKCYDCTLVYILVFISAKERQLCGNAREEPTTCDISMEIETAHYFPNGMEK